MRGWSRPVRPARQRSIASALNGAPALVTRRFAGRYVIEGGGNVTIAVRGSTLTMELPGQPLYTLLPDRNNEFRLDVLSGYSVRFVLAPNGSVTQMRLIQPNGVFVATPAR
jgi:hypothetical protein